MIRIASGFLLECSDKEGHAYKHVFSRLESRALIGLIKRFITFKNYPLNSKQVVVETSKKDNITWKHPILIKTKTPMFKKDLTRELIEEALGITHDEWMELTRAGIVGDRLINCFYNSLIKNEDFYLRSENIDVMIKPRFFTYEFDMLLNERVRAKKQTTLELRPPPEKEDPVKIFRSVLKYARFKVRFGFTTELISFVSKETGYSFFIITQYVERMINNGLLTPLDEDTIIIEIEKIMKVMQEIEKKRQEKMEKIKKAKKAAAKRKKKKKGKKKKSKKVPRKNVPYVPANIKKGRSKPLL